MNKQAKATFIGRTLSLLCLAVCSAGVQAELDPKSSLRGFDATYSARFSGAKIEIQTEFSRDPVTGNYVFRRFSEPRGLASIIRSEGVLECARFTLSPEAGFQPNYYRYRDGDDGGGKSSEVRFSASEAISSYRGSEVTLSTKSEPVDKILEELLVVQRLASGKRRFSLDVIERNEVHRVSYELLGEATIKVRAGKFDTLLVERRRGESSRTTRFWLAPELGYKAVKIERLRKGKSQGKAQLSQFSWRDQARGKVTPVCP